MTLVGCDTSQEMLINIVACHALLIVVILCTEH